MTSRKSSSTTDRIVVVYILTFIYYIEPSSKTASCYQIKIKRNLHIFVAVFDRVQHTYCRQKVLEQINQFCFINLISEECITYCFFQHFLSKLVCIFRKIVDIFFFRIKSCDNICIFFFNKLSENAEICVHIHYFQAYSI